MKIILRSILLIVFTCSAAISQWQQTNGMNNLWATSIVTNGSVMAAGTSINILTNGAIYISTNNGMDWTIVNTGIQGLSGIFSLAVKDNSIYAGTYEDGLLVSSDNGNNWFPNLINGDPHAGVFELGVSGNNIFAYLNTGNNHYVTSNNGASWSAVTFTGGVINDLYDNGTVFFAASRYGIFKSTNNGFNWTQSSNNGLPPFPDGSKRTTAVITLGNKLFTGLNSTPNSIFASTDEGNNWSQTAIVLEQNAYPSAFEKSGNKIFAAIKRLNNSPSQYGVIMSTNDGANWTAVNEGLPDGTSVHDLLIFNNKLFACTGSSGVWQADISSLTGINKIEDTEIPGSFSLGQNYPNPFNPNTSIKFSLPVSSNTTLTVYNQAGETVSILVNGKLSAGSYLLNYDASLISSGVYFYTLKTEGYTETRKFVLLK